MVNSLLGWVSMLVLIDKDSVQDLRFPQLHKPKLWNVSELLSLRPCLGLSFFLCKLWVGMDILSRGPRVI